MNSQRDSGVFRPPISIFNIPPSPTAGFDRPPANSPRMPVRGKVLRSSARAWTAVALYRFEDGPATHDGVALRPGLRMFGAIKIMSKIKIKKSTRRHAIEFRE